MSVAIKLKNKAFRDLFKALVGQDSVEDAELSRLLDMIKLAFPGGTDKGTMAMCFALLRCQPDISLDVMRETVTLQKKMLRELYKDTRRTCVACGQYQRVDIVEDSPRGPAASDEAARLKAIASLPRNKKSPRTQAVLLVFRDKLKKQFTVSDLEKDYPHLKINTIREILRILKLEGELAMDGKAGAEWRKTSKFGTSDVWKLLDENCTVKISEIIDRHRKSEKKPKKTPAAN
jgi:hypothetical protein